MTLLDKMIGTVRSSVDERRLRARELACARAAECDWFAEVLRHHVAIEQALEAVHAAPEPSAGRHALRWLATLMKGHAVAENSVLYPALSFDGQKAHAVSAFADESSFRIDLAGLALLEPGSPDFVDKLEAPRADVSLHFYEEEGAWYPALCRREGGLGNARLCTQFIEEFRRYMGPDAELL
ncbi:MAG TPA: hemerythrin domain-containing protein [Burkholderiaceae bacterium]